MPLGVTLSNRSNDIGDLIGQLYDAAVDRSAWPHALRSIASLMEGTAAVVSDSDTGMPPIVAASGIDSDACRIYNEYFIHVDPRVPRGLQLPLGRVYTHTTMGITDQMFDNSEYYRDHLRRYGLFYTAAVGLPNGRGGLSILAVLRARRRGEFSALNVAAFTSLLPYAQRALALRDHTNRTQYLYNVSRDVLDRISMGIVVVLPPAACVTMNRAAEQVLALRDGLAVEGGRLVCRRAAGQAHLEQLVANATQLLGHDQLSMQVPRPSGVAPWSLSVSSGRTPGTAILCIAAPEHTRHLSCESIRGLYGLTRAEARLAVALIRGRTVVEAASDFEISIHTARNQLKSVFMKLDVTSQSQLVARITTGPAMLMAGGV